MTDPKAFYLAGKPQRGEQRLEVLDKHSGKVFETVSMGGRATIDLAIVGAVEGGVAMRAVPTHARRDALAHVARRIGERGEEIARTLAVEAGKPIRDARVEVSRAVDTFRTASEECGRLHGEHMALDISPRSEGMEAVWKRVPVGACAFITPFNFPLNLVAHKVAPAIAAGCSFVLKPASKTPLCALLIGELLAETKLPGAAFSIVPCTDEDAAALVEDHRIKLLSFTGSQTVGWALKAKAGRKRVTLELGGNAACIVDKDADLARAADRITAGAYGYAGQSCISVQRVIAHEAILPRLVGMLVEKARALKVGPPLEESTQVGPLISVEAAKRVEEWVNEAAAGGARVLTGGRRDGAFYQPTLLENVNPKAKVSCQEVFGPVKTIQGCRDFEEALRIANDSDFGLQAGVFTRDIHHAMRAWNTLEVGGVIINDIPGTRVDNMPYGGVKESGLGREGVRFAMEEMTEMRLMVLSGVGKDMD